MNEVRRRELEKAFDDDDIKTFERVAKTLTAEELNAEYPLKVWGFRFGTALHSSVIRSAMGDDSRYLRILLELGADPNHISLASGTTALGILYDPSIQAKMVYHETFIFSEDEEEDEAEDAPSALERTVQILLDYGADFEQLVNSDPEAKASTAIENILNLALQRIDQNEMDPKKLEYIRARLCENLSRENGMTELRAMAGRLGMVRYSKLRKADLCANLAMQLMLHRAQKIPLVQYN